MTMVFQSGPARDTLPSPTLAPSRVSQRLKILHVLDHSVPLHSGYSFRTLAILREQRALGWQTVQLTTPKHTMAGPEHESVDGFAFYRTASLGARGDLPLAGEIALVQAVTRRIIEVAAIERPHVLHAHSPVLNAMACLRASSRLGLPVVYEVRAFWEDAAVDLGTAVEGGLRYRLIRAMESRALRRSDAIATICEGLRGDMIARGLPEEKITVVPNAVDVDRFEYGKGASSELKGELGLEGRSVIGFIGSFYAYEGLDLLVRAMPRILEQRPDVVLLLVGGGNTEEALRKLVDDLALGHAVRFIGRVPHQEVPRYYDLMDLLIYPRHSMRLTELVTPLKPLEAMARGRLVLVSDVGGHRELVREGKTGFFFRSGDVEALAGAALAVLESPSGWDRVRTAARAFVEIERTWENSVARYCAVYERVLAGREGTGYSPGAEKSGG